MPETPKSPRGKPPLDPQAYPLTFEGLDRWKRAAARSEAFNRRGVAAYSAEVTFRREMEIKGRSRKDAQIEANVQFREELAGKGDVLGPRAAARARERLRKQLFLDRMLVTFAESFAESIEDQVREILAGPRWRIAADLAWLLLKLAEGQELRDGAAPREESLERTPEGDLLCKSIPKLKERRALLKRDPAHRYFKRVEALRPPVGDPRRARFLEGIQKTIGRYHFPA